MKILIDLDKRIVKDLEKAAKKDNRSRKNLIEFLIAKDIDARLKSGEI